MARLLPLCLLALAALFAAPAFLPPPARPPRALERANTAASSAAPPKVAAGGGRRAAGLGALLAAVVGLTAVGRPRKAEAFQNEANRIGLYNDKAAQINNAVDWYLFDVRPNIFPPKELLELSMSCEEAGDGCVALAGLSKVVDMYAVGGAIRGGGQVVVSKLERELFTPMKTLATSSVFDPDTEDDLSTAALQMEKSQYQLASAAKKRDLDKVKQLYFEGVKEFNKYFTLVNAQTGLPEKSEHSLTTIPSDEELDKEYYWQRRKQKYEVKKMVDTMSKGSKTARFYAKSMFGEDAVSWDVRGDRADEFYNGKKN